MPGTSQLILQEKAKQWPFINHARDHAGHAKAMNGRLPLEIRITFIDTRTLAHQLAPCPSVGCFNSLEDKLVDT
jgi:hypothetical protein